MATQAVIKLAGHQYLISQGDTFTIDKHLPDKEGDNITIDQVLLVVNGDKAKIGTPLVKDASVKLTVEKLQRGPKINILRFKAKSRYRRRLGHRQPQTVLKVDSINLK